MAGEKQTEQEPIVAGTQSSLSARERWYGVLLMVGMGGVCAGLLGLVFWWGYAHVYVPMRTGTVSIENIAQESFSNTSDQAETQSDKGSSDTYATNVSTSDTHVAVTTGKQANITVLNGGGVKGSAAALAALLKKEGYQKVTLGNTVKDYTGMTLYFSIEQEDTANEIKKTILKQYPKMVSKAAVATDTETSGTPIVIIIGK